MSWYPVFVYMLSFSAACLFGYGAYEHVHEPTFSRALPSLLDRGVIWAHAHSHICLT